MNSASQLVNHQQTLYESQNATRRWLHRSRRDWIVDWIDRKVPSGVTAMEVGPGSGIYLPVLARRFQRVLAVDCESAYLEHAKQLESEFPAISTHVDDITRCSLGDGIADFILCTEVVEHIARSDLAIKEMRRLLKRGGLLLLSTPQRWSALEVTARVALSPALIWLARAVYRESVIDMGHINLMTAKTVVGQMEAAGFRVLDRHTSGLYLPLIAEIGGEWGADLSRKLERLIRPTRLRSLLWTQFYLAVAA